MVKCPAVVPRLILLLALSQVALAHAAPGPGDACEKGGLWKRLVSILKPKSSAKELPPIPADERARILADYNGIEFVAQDVERGRHGGHLISLTAREKRVKRIPIAFARSRESDPSRVWATTGTDIADFFGYGTYDSVDRIPDLVELNAAIAKINERSRSVKGEALLPFTFVEMPSRIASREYLKLVHQGLLPVAKRGHYRLHDLLSHWSALFLPDDAVAHAKSQIAAYFEFEEWLKKARPSAWSEARFNDIAEDLGMNIDFGNFNYVLGVDGGQVTKKTRFFDGLNQFASDGNSPKATLEGLIRGTSHRYNPEEDDVFRAFREFVDTKAGDASFSDATYDPSRAIRDVEVKFDRVLKLVKKLKQVR